jgi:hypothetical protein
MAQPQPIKHFSALGLSYLLECGFLPYDVYGGDLVGFKKRSENGRSPQLGGPNSCVLMVCFLFLTIG